MPLYAGICETDITPPAGVWMCGYAFRPTGATAVHDPLYARALVLDDGTTPVAILAMDLIGLDFDMVDAVRTGISERTGIPASAILLNATHTHGGPNVKSFNTMGSRDPAYVDILARKLVGITAQAAQEMHPVSLAWGRAPVQIGVNRRQFPRSTDAGATRIGVNRAGPVMPWVDALVVRDSREEPVALLFTHACHPTTLGGDNLEITADFCGFACETIRRETASGVTPFFLQGCCSNINPEPRGTFELARMHGETLGEAAIEAMATAEPLDGAGLAFADQTIDLPLIAPPDVEECERRVAEWNGKLDAERAGGNMGRILYAEGLRDFAEYERNIAADSSASQAKPFTLQRLSIGEAQILGMPAEMFVQYGLDFLAQAEGPAMALGYTNGVHGYVPTAADYPLGGYEVDGAHRFYATLMYTPDCERLIRESAYRLMGVKEPDWTPYGV